jgi:AcrR family transcriptional regulator
MPSITRRPPNSDDCRSAVKARLLAATQHLLAEGVNFTELGVQRIAAEAKVARSSFYVHFKDKSEVLLLLAAALNQKSFALVSQWQTDQDAGCESLTRLYEDILVLYRENGTVLAAINEVAAYDPAVHAFWTAQLDRFCAAAAEHLRRYQRDGLPARNVNPAVVAKVIVFGGFSVLAQHVAEGDSSEDAVVARELALTYWHGAFQRPAP